MSTLTKRDRERNLEIAAPKPNLTLIMSELESAQSDIDFYLSRNNNSYNYWHARWPGQSITGRKTAADAFPWPNASDARIRTVEQVVRDHVMVSEAIIAGARVQAQSVRPFLPGQAGRSNRVSKLLQWEVGTHMRPNLHREIPLAMNWLYGYGAAVMGIEWRTTRRLEFHELTADGFVQWIAIQEEIAEEEFPSLLTEVEAMFFDPGAEETLADYVQSLSPDEISRTKARSILDDLRKPEGVAEIPVPYIYEALPVWTSRRPGVEIIFPGETDDLQKARWVALRELVTETELRDRIVTEDYDKPFVEEAVKHKGKGLDGTWLARTENERGEFGGADRTNSFDNMIELLHFDTQVSHKGTPCSYRTVFCPHVLRGPNNSRADLYAKHGPRGYKHGQVPALELRFEKRDRPILSSEGIPEKAYTWEQAIKRQLDGVTDRTDIVLQPPLITRYDRVGAIKGTMGPRAVLGTSRPNELSWMPLPPFDNTPAAVTEIVLNLVDRFFPLFGNELDPDLKRAYRGKLSIDRLAEMDLCFDQTFQLMQEFISDEEAAGVVGDLGRFQVSREEIQEKHEITVTFDPRMLEEDYMKTKIELLLQAMQFNQSGGANLAGIFRNVVEGIDPDAAAEMVDDQEVATDRERRDEENALALMLAGIEPYKPMFANHKLRIATLEEKLQANPEIMKRLSQMPDALELIKNRMEFHENQDQQYTENPGIGRALSTQALNKRKAPKLALAGS